MMGLVKVVVQLKNDIAELKPEQYISVIQSVGMALRDLIRSVDDILPTLHDSVRTEVGPSLLPPSLLGPLSSS